MVKTDENGIWLGADGKPLTDGPTNINPNAVPGSAHIVKSVSGTSGALFENGIIIFNKQAGIVIQNELDWEQVAKIFGLSIEDLDSCVYHLS